MEITSLGDKGFKIKGKKTIIFINPPLDLKNLTAHIIISQERSGIPGIKGEPVVIFGPGEYEIREVRILGVKEKEGLIYKIKMDDISFLYLNTLPEKISEEKVEVLNETDILFLPAGRSKAISSLISQLEPLVVVSKKEWIEDFLKEEGVEEVERLSKFIIIKEELPEERKIVILK